MSTTSLEKPGVSDKPLDDQLIADLNPPQREAVVHQGSPLLIVAGAGTGKTTVITRRIAWLINTKKARPDEILALTFTDKAAAEMEQRVDLLVPYGYLDVWIKTFHAFGDWLLREHATTLGLLAQFRVLSKAEQLLFLRQHIFDLPLERFRPGNDPTRFVEALAAVFSRAKDEAVMPQEFSGYAARLQKDAAGEYCDEPLRDYAAGVVELANGFCSYQELLRKSDAVDFGDQVLLAIQLLERSGMILAALRDRFRYILVDEFQDTNYAQFRLLQILASANANVTVVADDDQSIYKWRGAAISNVVKFLEYYSTARTVVLTENFRSPQAILDCAYRLIRFNDPDRLEVKQGIDKRLTARSAVSNEEAHFQVFDSVSSESDWIAQTIRSEVESGKRRPSDFAILVRSNREADMFIRALNVAGLPWCFSGASGLFAREETKMLISCLKTLADPEDSLSWYHVVSSFLYKCPIGDLTKIMSRASRLKRSFRWLIERLDQETELSSEISANGLQILKEFMEDVNRLLALSSECSAGQLLYRWLKDRALLAELSRVEDERHSQQIQTIARFFDQLHRIEELVGSSLQELILHLELFKAMGNEPLDDDDAWSDRVNVLTIHKAKGLEFPVVFLVGLVQGRFPTAKRRDPIELPEGLIKDIIPEGDYHLQEERRLFYVGMTRAKESLYLSCAYDYGGKTARKVSQFVLEALNLCSPTPKAKVASARELIERSDVKPYVKIDRTVSPKRILRLDPHGLDDYLTCSLKYRYSHILKIPVMQHHLVVYGSAIHKAIEAFFKRTLSGELMAQDELIGTFERHWNSQGFLSREHEELRLSQGRQTLKRFHSQQLAFPEKPSFIEEKFRFLLDDILVVGRFDRVDCAGDEVVIIDYKSSDIREQEAANKRARESLQMRIYCLAWNILHGKVPTRVELRFIDTNLVGTACFSEDDLERTKALLAKAAKGIRESDFHAKPQEHSCHWCAFQSICSFAFQPQ